MAVNRFKVLVEYDGTGLVGWQRQRSGRSVQEILERAILGYCGEEVTVTGAGRTDAGVHALGQVAHFDLNHSTTAKTVRDALNDHIRKNSDGPRQVSILSTELVSNDFHARFSAVSRRYVYRIINRLGPLTLENSRAWHIFQSIDDESMHEAAQILVGKHDFTTFRSVHCQARSPKKTIDSLLVWREGENIWLEAIARSFLHNQVRAMTGSLVEVGIGKSSSEMITKALESRDRTNCGPTAPAAGLYLAEVRYS